MSRSERKNLHLHRRASTAAIVLAALAVAGTAQSPARAAEQKPATPARAVPDFSGYWSHNVSHYTLPESGPGPVTDFPGQPHLYGQDRGKGAVGTTLWIGDYRNPILQPWAAAIVKKHGDDEKARGESLWQPLQLCELVGVPHILLVRDPVVLLQQPHMVTLVYERDHQTRRVYLDEKQPATVVPSAYGHSVGHYEGDTLVVDTVGMTATLPIDYYGTPHTERMHVVERYRVVGGNMLEVRFTVDDPGTFTTPWTGMQKYRRIARKRGLEETICAENPKDIGGTEYPLPKATKADF